MNRRFDQTAVRPVQPIKAADLPPGMHIERRTPVHAPTVTGQVWVPFLRAVFTGIWFALLGVIITVASGWPAWVPLVCFVLAGLAVWCAKGLSDHLLFLVETATGRDIDGDGEVGRPQEGFTVEQVERKATGGSQWTYVNFKGKTEDFARFAFAALTGGSLTMGGWSGGAHPWSRADYIHNREECRRLRWIIWRDERNHNLGLDVTEKGEVGFGQWLQEHARARAYATDTPQALHEPEGRGVRQIEHIEDERGKT